MSHTRLHRRCRQFVRRHLHVAIRRHRTVRIGDGCRPRFPANQVPFATAAPRGPTRHTFCRALSWAGESVVSFSLYMTNDTTSDLVSVRSITVRLAKLHKGPHVSHASTSPQQTICAAAPTAAGADRAMSWSGKVRRRLRFPANQVPFATATPRGLARHTFCRRLLSWAGGGVVSFSLYLTNDTTCGSVAVRLNTARLAKLHKGPHVSHASTSLQQTIGVAAPAAVGESALSGKVRRRLRFPASQVPFAAATPRGPTRHTFCRRVLSWVRAVLCLFHYI
jgi:hypothetical protein